MKTMIKIPDKKIIFHGTMTTLVKFAYVNMKDKIRFRSSFGEGGNVSNINVSGIKETMYATVQGADAFKTFVDEHPRCTLKELKEIVNDGNYSSELKEIVDFFCGDRYGWKVPVVQLDMDKI